MSNGSRSTPEQLPELPELAETDEFLEFHEFEDEDYLADPVPRSDPDSEDPAES